MAAFLIESIGFSATHSISEMLKFGGRNKVSHGSRNFIELTRLGLNDMQFGEFVEAMKKEDANFDNCIAIHCNWDADQVAVAAEKFQIPLYCLMRRSQFNQVLSHYYWILYEVLSGDETSTKTLAQSTEKYASLLRASGLPMNLSSTLLAHSADRTVTTNLKLSRNCKRVFFMEDIIASPTTFASALGLEGVIPSDLVVQKGPSHAERIKKLPFFEDSERILQVLFSQSPFSIGNRELNFWEVEKLIEALSEQRE